MIDWYRLLPRYWVQTERTNLDWDRALNKALDAALPTIDDKFTVTLADGRQVWVENWPYAYGTEWGHPTKRRGLPTVKTRKRLRDAVEAARVAELLVGARS